MTLPDVLAIFKSSKVSGTWQESAGNLVLRRTGHIGHRNSHGRAHPPALVANLNMVSETAPDLGGDAAPHQHVEANVAVLQAVGFPDGRADAGAAITRSVRPCGSTPHPIRPKVDSRTFVGGIHPLSTDPAIYRMAGQDCCRHRITKAAVDAGVITEIKTSPEPVAAMPRGAALLWMTRPTPTPDANVPRQRHQ